MAIRGQRRMSNPVYKPVQMIGENDSRTIEDRMASLPAIREEDFPEWEEWANRTFDLKND